MVHHRIAFTLIELMVVLTLMLTFSSMIVSLFSTNEKDALTTAAVELQTVLQRARSLSRSTQQGHAVIFHIENSGDGSVLKNFSDIDDAEFKGRHWYAIIGPDTSTTELENNGPGSGRNTQTIPKAKYKYGWYTFLHLSDYEEGLKGKQIGPRHYLPQGVRFLALSDTDNEYGSYNEDSYPRPWFGYYDSANKKLYPWGAYNRDIDAALEAAVGKFACTGLDYEGDDGQIAYDANSDCNLNPSSVWGRIHATATAIYPSDVTGSGKFDPCGLDMYGDPNLKYLGPDTTLYAGKPRAVVNGYWGDYMIMFDATGSAMMEHGHGRRLYFSSQYDDRNTPDWDPNNGCSRKNMEVSNATNFTGAMYITLARDIDIDDEVYNGSTDPISGASDYYSFESVDDALESITPFVRIRIEEATGVSNLQRSDHPHSNISADDLIQHKAYPRGYE
ncbi:MAG: hypothetical protein HRU15_04735 [Planctomycetes bacterium]|nr:hypothetical protein [Planctomycetota bacterium]